MNQPGVKVTGLREVVSAFRQVDLDLPKELKVEFKKIAEDVATTVRASVPRGPTGHAAGSVKARATQRGAAIAFGGSAAPYFPWLDFGGTTGPGHKPKVAGSGSVKRPWMGKPDGEGRYVYPGIRKEREHIAQAADDAVRKAAEQAGFETKGHA